MAGTYRYTIEPGCVDARLRARVCSLVDLILRAAGDDADTLGLGVGDLNSGGASWVLSRMAVELRRRPARGEGVGVYTWVSDYGRLFTTRNMTVEDDGGETVGAAVTQWAMIDLATRRPLDLSALPGREASLVDREPPIAMPLRLVPLAGGGGAAGTGGDVAGVVTESRRTVAYSDIDFNGHTASVKYLEWMVDALPYSVAEEMDSLRLDINFIHEARAGEPLSVCLATDSVMDGETRGANGYRFEIRDAAGQALCRAAMVSCKE